MTVLLIQSLDHSGITRAVRPFETGAVGEAFGMVHLVGGRDPAALGVVEAGMFGIVEKAFPLVSAGAGYRHQPVPVRSLGPVSGPAPAHIAGDIGQDQFRPGRAPTAPPLDQPAPTSSQRHNT